MLPGRKTKLILGLVLLIFSLAGLLAAFTLVKKPKKESLSQAAGATADFWVEIGEEEYMMGPVGSPIDSPFFALSNADGVRAFSANGDTYTFFGPNLNLLNSQGIALSRGQSGRFDECGAWLHSINKLDENHWLGWYHAENECPYTGGQTHASMAFAESFDGGRTWQKPNYPNNQVVTADTQFNDHPDSDDTGGGRVIKIGNYFYMFYQSTGKYNPDGTPNYSQTDYIAHIARSSVSAQGKPGAWYKYYNGSFSEPGLGGRSTPVNTLNSYGNFISYNSYLNRYLSVLTTGRWGFILYFSSGDSEQDILNGWSGFPVTLGEKSIFPQVSHNLDDRVDNWWARNSGSKQVYSYASLVSLDGQNDITGQQFYLYYMKLFDGEDFGNSRYLFRRKITLHKNSESPFSYSAAVALVRYEKQSPQKTKVSTEIAKPSEGYQKKADLGYLLPYESTGFKPLYECYIPIWDDYYLFDGDPSLLNWEHCKDTNDIFVRRIGWISETQTTISSRPLYRCFDKTNSDHFASFDPNCEGKTKEFLLGYPFEQGFLNQRCTVSISNSKISEGQTIKVNFSGKPDTGDIVQLWLEEANGNPVSHAEQIKYNGNSYLNSAVSNGKTYYRLAFSPDASQHSRTLSLPEGKYFLHCDVNVSKGVNRCSGNPFCDYEIAACQSCGSTSCGSNDCSSTWTDCSNSDNSYLEVTTAASIPLSFKIKFQGIDSQKPDKAVRVILRQAGVEKYRFESVNVKSDSGGIYSGTTPEITPGAYDVLVKDLAHLQKKFASVTINSTMTAQDWSSASLKAGDFDNNNILNITDISNFLALYNSLSVPVTLQNQIYDIDANNVININDISLVLANYNRLEVQGDE